MCSHHNKVRALSQLQPVTAPATDTLLVLATDTLLVLAAVLLHEALTKLSTWQGCVKSWTLVHPLQLVCVQRMVDLYESHYTLLVVVVWAGHVINNAYGVQAGACTNAITEVCSLLLPFLRPFVHLMPLTHRAYVPPGVCCRPRGCLHPKHRQKLHGKAQRYTVQTVV